MRAPTTHPIRGVGTQTIRGTRLNTDCHNVRICVPVCFDWPGSNQQKVLKAGSFKRDNFKYSLDKFVKMAIKGLGRLIMYRKLQQFVSVMVIVQSRNTDIQTDRHYLPQSLERHSMLPDKQTTSLKIRQKLRYT